MSNPNKFPKSITTKNHATSGNAALENFLSLWKESIIFLSNADTIFKIAVFNFEVSFLRAFFANKAKIITKIKKMKVATFVLLIGP